MLISVFDVLWLSVIMLCVIYKLLFFIQAFLLIVYYEIFFTTIRTLISSIKLIKITKLIVYSSFLDLWRLNTPLLCQNFILYIWPGNPYSAKLLHIHFNKPRAEIHYLFGIRKMILLFALGKSNHNKKWFWFTFSLLKNTLYSIQQPLKLLSYSSQILLIQSCF